MRAPRSSMSVTTASNTSPIAVLEHHRFGEVDDGALDLAAARVGAGHDRGQAGEGLGRRHPAPAGHWRSRARPGRHSGRRGGAAARWRGRRSRPSRHARAAALAPGRIGGARAGAADRDHEGGLLRVARDRACARSRASGRAAGQSRPNARAVRRRRRDGALVGLGHHPEQAGPVRLQRVGDGEIGGERERGVAVLGRIAGAEGQLDSGRPPSATSCSGGSTRAAPRLVSAAWMRAASSAKPAGSSASVTLS